MNTAHSRLNFPPQSVANHVQGFFPGSSCFKRESFFVCFQQITPGIVCPALRAFTSKAVCLAVAMCDLASLHSLCLSVHCCTRMKRPFFCCGSRVDFCVSVRGKTAGINCCFCYQFSGWLLQKLPG